MEQTYEQFMTFATETLAWVAKQPKFKITPKVYLDPKVVAQNDEVFLLELEYLAQAEAWAKKQPKFKVKPQPKNIDETYQANNLMHIRFDGKIIKKPGGKRKIDGRRPAYSQLTEQPKYNKYSGRYYS